MGIHTIAYYLSRIICLKTIKTYIIMKACGKARVPQSDNNWTHFLHVHEYV